MSSPYPVLKNRPIDQWKVVELRAELKKRKLTTSGLKANLIKRLEKALLVEREAAAENDVDAGVKGDLEPVVEAQCEQTNKPVENTKEAKLQLENEGLKPSLEGDIHDSASNNQVFEVNTCLGIQVKSDSIFIDSASVNEKIELKDTITDDNVKLEIDIVRSEMVEPSSSNVVAVSGEAHPMDVEEPHEKKASVEERDDENNDNANMSDSEKLNLDRSSGDDSLDEDVLDAKQIDSESNVDVEDKIDKNVMEGLVDVVGDGLSLENKDVLNESKSHPAPAEKRKLQEQEVDGSNEASKRRRWNSENVKVPEQQGTNLTPTTTPKDTFQPTGLKCNFSRSDSTVCDDAPKERVVPPPPKPPNRSLRIDRFLRPFTLKAVHELLGKTGSVTSFWMDNIKTHCYVTYSSVEEAIETRNAVYNLQWPPNGGRFLVAEFVDPDEVKIHLEAPPQTAAPPAQAAMQQPQPWPRQQINLLPPPQEKLYPPIVTLDDLFRKTRATPRIYYLPLSEEKVAVKLVRARRGKNTKQ